MKARVIKGIAILLMVCSQTVHSKAISLKKVTTAEVKEYMGKGYVVVSGLVPDLFADCSIPGSINIPGYPVDKKAIRGKAQELKGKKLIVHCAGPFCAVSHFLVTEFLLMNDEAEQRGEEMPFGDILYYNLGIAGWLQAGEKPSEGNKCEATYLKTPVKQ